MEDGTERSEVVAMSVDPSFASYLHQDYLSDNHGRKESSAIVLKRNLQKFCDPNESDGFRKATESTRIVNGLECKMSSGTSKISYESEYKVDDRFEMSVVHQISYVLDTEDFFFRPGQRKNNTAACSKSKKAAKSQRFYRFLEAAPASSSAATTASC
ncbi:hypothetical protein M569_06633 [Genlisea aurea]|uniref:Uncharacterized protein n=1 Tax=Genlisea aurea TaxID=192259 RepID=S8CN36_9LAMI|nr:hypothetical protein M569_06633 [Genlisea aurea]